MCLLYSCSTKFTGSSSPKTKINGWKQMSYPTVWLAQR